MSSPLEGNAFSYPLTRAADVAFREFVSKMYGVVPNRLLMTSGNAELFMDEILTMSHYQMPDLKVVVYRGMRLVVDDNAVGVEVGYVR